MQVNKYGRVACGFLFALIVFLLMIVGCGRSPSYNSFMASDKESFVQLSAACDALIAARAKGNPALLRIPGDDPSLPVPLSRLHASWIQIGPSNQVFIPIGNGRGAFGISWSQSSRNPAVWELQTAAESYLSVVYSTNKAVVSNQNIFTFPVSP